MKMNKTILAAGTILLLAGVAAIALIANNSKSENSSAQTARKAPEARQGALSPAGDSGDRAADRARSREAIKNQELVAKYGESRTNLSKHISNNLISLLDDAVQMGEMMSSGKMGAGFGGGRGGLGMALGALNNNLQLTEEQKDKATKMLAERQKRQTATTKEAIERLKKDPSSLMKLMLASDASSRGQMQDDEYKRVQAESGKDLVGVMNPLDRKNFGGGSPLKDEVFLSEFKSMLDPTQSEKLQASMAETSATATPADGPQIDETSVANMPKMELEKLDTTIESAKKITTGIKSMMDGFSGLKDLTPPPQEQGGQN